MKWARANPARREDAIIERRKRDVSTQVLVYTTCAAEWWAYIIWRGNTGRY